MTKTRTLRRLNHAQNFSLTQYVRDHYTASGLDDVAFIVKASTELGFPVGESSIDTARGTLQLANNRPYTRAYTNVGDDAPVTRADLAPIMALLGDMQTTIRGLAALWAPNAAPAARSNVTPLTRDT